MKAITATALLILVTIGPVSALLFHVLAKRINARRTVRRRLQEITP